jgi:hypothetical protein
MKRMILTLAVAAGVLCGFQNAQATPLLPGTPEFPGQPIVGVDNSAFLAGATLQANTGKLAFATPGATIGTLQEAVYREVGGTLDFLYQVETASGDPVVRLTATSYTGSTTDVGQTAAFGVFTDVGTLQAGTADRSASGNTVGFDFRPIALAPGFDSYVLIIRTNATSFKAGNMGVTDGGTANKTGFAPSPEPASVVLLGSCFAGLCGMGLLRLRRKTVPVV